MDPLGASLSRGRQRVSLEYLEGMCQAGIKTGWKWLFPIHIFLYTALITLKRKLWKLQKCFEFGGYICYNSIVSITRIWLENWLVLPTIMSSKINSFCSKKLLFFTLNFSIDVEQHCFNVTLAETTAERRASRVARPELHFQASCQDSCTHLEDLQPHPWGASEEHLMHGYLPEKEETQMGTERRPLLCI